jgi:hypothetical protein
MTNAYRFQPIGADLHAIETETSEGNAAGGVHVFDSLQACHGISGWRLTDEPVELVTIECEPRDLRDSEDYEGSTLRAGRGQIVTRHVFTGGLIEARKWLNENA